MNIYAVISLVTAVVFLHLGDLIYFRDSKNTYNRLLMLFCFTFAYLSFIEFGYRQTRFSDVALLAYNIGAFWPLALSFLLHFILVFTNVSLTGERRLLYVLIYGPALVFPIMDLTTNWITAGMVLRYWGWSHVYANSLAVYFYMVWLVIMYVISAFLSF